MLGSYWPPNLLTSQVQIVAAREEEIAEPGDVVFKTVPARILPSLPGVLEFGIERCISLTFLSMWRVKSVLPSGWSPGRSAFPAAESCVNSCRCIPPGPSSTLTPDIEVATVCVTEIRQGISCRQVGNGGEGQLSNHE